MKNKLFDFYKDKTIWIIGRSFGLATELAKSLAITEANLIISAKSINRLQKIKQYVLEKFLKKIKILPFDIIKENQFSHAITSIESEIGNTIDIIIFCPNSYYNIDIENINLNEANEIFDVNVISFLNFIKSTLPYIKSNQIKRVVVINSILGYVATPKTLVYGASKAAMQHIAESFYYTISQYKTKLLLINPGFINSKFLDKNTFDNPFSTVVEMEDACEKITKIIMNDKHNFNICFPKFFSFAVKLLNILPFSLQKKIINKIYKSNELNEDFVKEDTF